MSDDKKIDDEIIEEVADMEEEGEQDEFEDEIGRASCRERV